MGHTGSADEALARIDRLFRIEGELRDQELAPQVFVQRRREEVTPILEKLRWQFSTEIGGSFTPAYAARAVAARAVEQF